MSPSPHIMCSSKYVLCLIFSNTIFNLLHIFGQNRNISCLNCFIWFCNTVCIFSASIQVLNNNMAVNALALFCHLSSWKEFYEYGLLHACGRWEMPVIFYLKFLKERDHLKELRIDGIDILKYIAKEDVRVWTGLACLSRVQAIATVPITLLFL